MTHYLSSDTKFTELLWSNSEAQFSCKLSKGTYCNGEAPPLPSFSLTVIQGKTVVSAKDLTSDPQKALELAVLLFREQIAAEHLPDVTEDLLADPAFLS